MQLNCKVIKKWQFPFSISTTPSPPRPPPSGLPPPLSSKIFGTPSPQVTDNSLKNKLEFKDLDVIVDNHLTFSNNIAEKVSKANQIMGLIWKTFVFLDKYNFNLLYKSSIYFYFSKTTYRV